MLHAHVARAWPQVWQNRVREVGWGNFFMMPVARAKKRPDLERDTPIVALAAARTGLESRSAKLDRPLPDTLARQLARRARFVAQKKTMKRNQSTAIRPKLSPDMGIYVTPPTPTGCGRRGCRRWSVRFGRPVGPVGRRVCREMRTCGG